MAWRWGVPAQTWPSASDMVVTDDNFVSIVAGVEEGRVVFDNVRKVTFFLIPTGSAVVFFDFMQPFLPAQLLWLNLVTNSVQDIALAFEPGEKDVLKRKPRPANEGIIPPLLWERTLIAGVVMAAGTLFLSWTRRTRERATRKPARWP